MKTALQILSEARTVTDLPDTRLDEVAAQIDGDPVLTALLAQPFSRQAERFAYLPELKARLGERYMAFFVLHALQLVPQTVTFYREKGLSAQMLHDTLFDIDRNMKEFEDLTGLFGMGGERYEWIFNHLECRLFQLGRLQFMASRLERDILFGSTLLPAGTPVIETHIYAGAPLAPDACEDAFRASLRFHKEVFGIEPAGFTCESWLLSPELQPLLPPDSNIARFAARYTLAACDEWDDSHLQYAFGVLQADPRTLPETNALQRNLKQYLLQGGKLHMGYGFQPNGRF